jgi:hypothetical protein
MPAIAREGSAERSAELTNSGAARLSGRATDYARRKRFLVSLPRRAYRNHRDFVAFSSKRSRRAKRR